MPAPSEAASDQRDLYLHMACQMVKNYSHLGGLGVFLPIISTTKLLFFIWIKVTYSNI